MLSMNMWCSGWKGDVSDQASMKSRAVKAFTQFLTA